MSKIRILSEHLANQIAAGEVVERPASVVKELVENSLDAGATRLSVQVEGNGTRLIRVADNGVGMGGDDVLLSIERHATSKLHDDSSLDSIRTLGFRGEALPSIGSVSRLMLLSRPADKETGTRADIRFGTLHGVHEDGCAPGTIVEVRNLFGNLPARKKFLKSGRTELFHIEEVVRNQSLAHIRTAFSLQVENRSVFDLPVRDTLDDRVQDIFRGRNVWLRLDGGGEDDREPILRGCLLEPDSAASRGGRLRILVNGRPVQDRMIRHAVVEGLHGFLMKGQSPVGVLLLEIPPDQIDVNVHPAKQEIRFRNGQDVHRFVVRTVAASVRKYQDQLRSDIFRSSRQEESVQNREHAGKGKEPVAPSVPRPLPGGKLTTRVPNRGQESERPEPISIATSEPTAENSFAARQSVAEERPDFSGLQLIGQLSELYLLCERQGELVVIDQHAAHERILYQQLLESYLEKKVPRQNLMFPLTLELDRRQAEIIEKHGQELELLGFGVEPFGEETWVVKAVPALMARVDAKELIQETLARLTDGSDRETTGAVPSRIDHLLATMACKAAVKSGNRLAPEEMLALLAAMEQSDFFSHCPHGRPVFRIFTPVEIAQWFKRG